jgi:hypothetical protein
VSAVINEADYKSPKDSFTVGAGYLHVLSFGCNAQYYSPTCPTTNLGSQVSLGETSLSNNGSVYAVGFTYFYDQRSVATVTFGDGSTQVLDLVLPIFPTFPDVNITPRFVGIESTLGIKSIDFVGVPATGYDEWLDKEYSFYTGNLLLDDLTIGSNGAAAVPEPATWAMMIVGFFGVGGLARRKARVLAA